VARAQVLRDGIIHCIFIFPRDDRAKIADVVAIEEPPRVRKLNIPGKEGRPSPHPGAGRNGQMTLTLLKKIKYLNFECKKTSGEAWHKVAAIDWHADRCPKISETTP